MKACRWLDTYAISLQKDACREVFIDLQAGIMHPFNMLGHDRSNSREREGIRSKKLCGYRENDCRDEDESEHFFFLEANDKGSWSTADYGLTFAFKGVFRGF